MEPFKNIFNKKAVKSLILSIKEQYPSLNDKDLLKEINQTLETLELKDRVRLISSALKVYLTGNYKKDIKILMGILPSKEDFLLWPLAQYIEDYGRDDLKTSMKAIYKLTPLFTGEFAIRPYLDRYGEQVYAEYLNDWVKDKNHHVRRLVSEGTRPNLPWGNKVEQISKTPAQNLYLLEQLKKDSEEYVRRSVANHMNDISRLDKKLMLDTCLDWQKDADENTRWVIRHATRSLLKQGNSKALKLNGFTTHPKVKISSVKISPNKIQEGDTFELVLKLTSEAKQDQNLLMDYIIHYPKKNGKLSPKAFRLKQYVLKAGESILISKKIHFKKVTTRVHYFGEHLLEVQVSDRILFQGKFTLLS